MLLDASDTAVNLLDTEARPSVLLHMHSRFLCLCCVSMSFHAKESQHTKCSDAMVSISLFKISFRYGLLFKH